MKEEKSKLDPWYVTGISEGEGCFTYNTSGRRISPVFAIKLTSSESRLLEILQEFFNAGKIYKVKAIAPRPNSGYTKASLYYKVFSIADLEKIIAHFESYPLKGEKRKRYEIWKEMVFIKKRNYKKRGFVSQDKLSELAQELSKLAPKNIPWGGENDHY